MTQLKQLHQEYQDLKKEIFGTSSFSLVDDTDPKQERYSQLLQFFHPEFRTKEYQSPITNNQK